MKMEINEVDTYDEVARPGVGGITLLEAYSALSSRTLPVSAAVEVPFPGQPRGTDPEGSFWKLRIRNTG